MPSVINSSVQNIVTLSNVQQQFIGGMQEEFKRRKVIILGGYYED
jgi:hypothetical protein